MKKTVNVAIGGCSFIIDEDAYDAISTYLDNFKKSMDESSSLNDVMDELECRMADLLKAKLGSREVVGLEMAKEVIEQLGYPDGYNPGDGEQTDGDPYKEHPIRKLFRDPDNKKIAGVCSGLATFLGVDVVIIRILFLIAFICGTAGGWIYIIIWIAAPEARTAIEKCELRGIPATAENIRKFTERQ